MTAPFIRAARFVGFKSLADVLLPLRHRFVLIVGRNASGKSSLLDGVHLVSQLCVAVPEDERLQMRRWARVFRGRHAVERVRTRGRDSMLLGVSSDDVAVWLRADGTHGEFPSEGATTVAIGGADQIAHRPIGKGRVAEITNQQPYGELRSFFAQPKLAGFGASVRLRLNAERAAAPALSRDEVPRVEDDGSGLPAVLNWLAANEPAVRGRIVEDLARVVPGVRGIRGPFTPVEVERLTHVQVGGTLTSVPSVEPQMGFGLEIDLHESGYLPADLVSEGTLLTLALLTVVHTSGAKLVLLDDIDRGLHPAAQIALAACLRRVLEQQPGLQIVATTHSPYLVDEMQGDEVVVLGIDRHGHTQARLLSEHPEWSKFQGSLGTGEFWSSVSDEWVTAEHAPAAE